MKILFIIPKELGRPGMADMNYFMLTTASLGLDVAVICQKGGQDAPHCERGITIFETAETGLAWFGFVRQSIKSFLPDIVHVSIHLGCGVYPLLAKKSTKFVLDIRSPLVRVGFLRYLVIAKNQLEILGYDQIMGHSVASAQTVIGGWHKDIKWVPPGVDLSMFRQGKLKKENKPIRFVYIGSLHRIRKVEDMLKGFVLAANMGVCFILDVYGVGDAQDTLKEMIENNSLQDNIFLKGLLPREELFSLLPDYDYGVSYVPKDIFDAAPPLKTMEYLASGIPVLATNTIGNKLFIKEGVNGLLVGEYPTEFSKGIAEAVTQVKGFSIRVKVQGTVSQYDWKTLVKGKLLSIYTGLLNEK